MINYIYKQLTKIFDRLLIPLENIAFDYYAINFPKRFERYIEKTIDRGFSYFENQSELSFDAIGVLTSMVNKSFDPRLDLLKEKILFYASRWKDPHLRILDADYDVTKYGTSSARPVDIESLDMVEKPIIQCIYADKLGISEQFLNELAKIDDNGSYGTTHKLLGAVLLKRFSNIPPYLIDNILKSCIKPILKAQRYACASDIFYERAVLLQWIGCEHLIRPAWIVRIMNAQMKNGGWCWERTFRRSEAQQHPSCLGLAALIQYREKQIRVKKGSSKAILSEIGNAFSISNF